MADTRAFLAMLGAGAPEAFREAAWLDDIFDFDPARFRMSPTDAALLDPEQRLFLETALMALEDAGYGARAWIMKRSAFLQAQAADRSGAILPAGVRRDEPNSCLSSMCRPISPRVSLFCTTGAARRVWSIPPALRRSPPCIMLVGHWRSARMYGGPGGRRQSDPAPVGGGQSVHHRIFYRPYPRLR